MHNALYLAPYDDSGARARPRTLGHEPTKLCRVLLAEHHRQLFDQYHISRTPCLLHHIMTSAPAAPTISTTIQPRHTIRPLPRAVGIGTRYHLGRKDGQWPVRRPADIPGQHDWIQGYNKLRFTTENLRLGAAVEIRKFDTSAVA